MLFVLFKKIDSACTMANRCPLKDSVNTFTPNCERKIKCNFITIKVTAYLFGLF